MSRKRKVLILTAVGTVSSLLCFLAIIGICILTLRLNIFLLLSAAGCTLPLGTAAFIVKNKLTKYLDNKCKAFKLVFFCSPLIAIPLLF